MDELKLDHLSSFLPQRAKTIEVGCGSARLSVFLAQRQFKTYGVDYELSALGTALNNFRHMHVTGWFCAANAVTLPFPESSFDVVLSTGLLEHFSNPLPVLEEMVRVVKPGGLFYADIVPKKFSLFRAFDGLRLRKWEVYEAAWNASQIKTFLHTVGLLNVFVFGAGVFPPLWFPLLSRYAIYHRLYNFLVRPVLPVLARLDGTGLAEVLGFYFFCIGYKPSPNKLEVLS